jgi:hypothetical protein
LTNGIQDYTTTDVTVTVPVTTGTVSKQRLKILTEADETSPSTMAVQGNRQIILDNDNAPTVTESQRQARQKEQQ